jgi:predicted ATPase
MLVCKQLEVESLPEGIEDLITEKAQGNPFYASEIVNSLVESKQIIVNHPEGKVIVPRGEIKDLDKIPDSVQVIHD